LSDPKPHTGNLLIFRCSGLDCAFPLEAVREIVPMAMLSTPPGMPSGLAGFLDLRGTAVPIVRLDRLFDLREQPPGLHTPMIVLGGIVLGGILGPIGVLVGSVRGIVSAPSAQPLDLPPDGTYRGCVRAVLQIDGEPVHLLSPAALLDSNEARLLADYGAMSRARLLQLEMQHLEEARS
jgi:purine-binding chemotaxis protein CheW